MKTEKYRDITLIHISKNTIMAVTCDSLGGIGNKELDIVKTDNWVLGYYTTIVVLAELMAFGAIPVTIVNNICMEMKSAGEQVIEGIEKAINEVELNDDVVITGSTEENIPVKQSGIGITAIGYIDIKQWKKPRTISGDSAFVVGIPHVGDEVLKFSNEIMNLHYYSRLSNVDNIREIVPVGSKGITYEINEISKLNNIIFEFNPNYKVDTTKSAGPATCAIITGNYNEASEYLATFELPWEYLGKFYRS